MVGAYVLITAEPGKAGDTVRQISSVDGVKSVHAVTGPYDAIAFTEVEDYHKIGDLVVAQIQKIDGVDRTLTCMTVPL